MPSSSHPVSVRYASERLTIGAGVAIFHLASSRVVVCYDPRAQCWFLPKGRKNTDEQVDVTAEREGFEESGYRNRLLPLPLQHNQTDPDEGPATFVTEPLWIELIPLAPHARDQYLLFWFAAETVPNFVEETYAPAPNAAIVDSQAVRMHMYRPPGPFPSTQSLQQRIDEDFEISASGERKMYEPIRHENTGVNEEELEYQSFLLPIEEAKLKLGDTVMQEVVKKAWEKIKLRKRMEAYQLELIAQFQRPG